MKTYKLVRNADFGGFHLSRLAEQWLAKRGIYNKYPEIEYLRDLPRHEPLLVECVETLGTEAASEPRVAKLEYEHGVGWHYMDRTPYFHGSFSFMLEKD